MGLAHSGIFVKDIHTWSQQFTVTNTAISYTHIVNVANYIQNGNTTNNIRCIPSGVHVHSKACKIKHKLLQLTRCNGWKIISQISTVTFHQLFTHPRKQVPTCKFAIPVCKSEINFVWSCNNKYCFIICLGHSIVYKLFVIWFKSISIRISL